MELPVLLVVDDYPETQKVFRLCLRRKYVIIVASTLEEARDILHTIDVDVVVLDYLLPDGLGPELLIDIPADTPTILLSGNPLIVRKYGNQFNAAFSKPCDLCGEVSPTIDFLLGHMAG